MVRSEDTTGPITGLALTSVNKFLVYGLISKSHGHLCRESATYAGKEALDLLLASCLLPVSREGSPGRSLPPAGWLDYPGASRQQLLLVQRTGQTNPQLGLSTLIKPHLDATCEADESICHSLGSELWQKWTKCANVYAKKTNKQTLDMSSK